MPSCAARCQARGRTGEEQIWLDVVAGSVQVEQERHAVVRRALAREPLWRAVMAWSITGASPTPVASSRGPVLVPAVRYALLPANMPPSARVI